MSTTKTKRGWVVVAALTIGLGACGSDDSEQNQGPDASTGGTGGAGGGGGADAGVNGGTGGVAGISGQGGTTPSGGSAGAGGLTGAPLGSACTEDSDCQTGLCLRADSNDFNQGGPANGYCTVDCAKYANDPSSPNPCSDYGGDTLCLPTASTTVMITKAYCLKGCVTGPPVDFSSTTLDELDPDKCFGRRDVVCQQLSDNFGNAYGTPVCVPHCQRDKDCAAAGRKCDPRFKVCRDEAKLTKGRELGAACSDYRFDKKPASDPCAGLCLTALKDSAHGNTDPMNLVAVCSESCIVNTFDSCGYSRKFSHTSPAICLFLPSTSGVGDIGYCMQLCDVDKDCSAWGDKVANAYCDLGTVSGIGRGHCSYRYGYWEGAAGAAASAGAGGEAGAGGQAGAAGA
nr:hypothetical protein [Polyangiaceae bacterium]